MQLREYLAAYRTQVSFYVRYGITGVVGALIQTSVLYTWVSLLGFQEEYLWGVAIGFGLAVITTFLLQKYWTFRDYAHYRATRQLILYCAFSIMNFGLNVFLLNMGKVVIESMGLDFFKVWYLAAQILVIGIVAVISFLSNRFITFRPESA